MKQLTVGFLMSVCAFAQAGTAMRCEAHGKALSKLGEKPLPVEANLTFVENVSTEGVRTLVNLKGRIVIDPQETVYGTYVGNFNLRAVEENRRYSPDKYVGFSQFPNFDAVTTRNNTNEQGMWGQFLLEQNTRKATFAAHYIFKAGDHMGGTIHFSCEKL